MKSGEAISLWQLAKIFLRLGVTAFGGPAANMAAMEQEFVKRRQWISRKDFLDFMSAANLIPGPNSTEVALHIGYEKRGLLGLLVAGICFILPAAVMVWIIALASNYFTIQQDAFTKHLRLVNVVMIAIIAQSLLSMASAMRKVELTAAQKNIGLQVTDLIFLNVSSIAFCTGLVFCGLDELYALVLTGFYFLMASQIMPRFSPLKTKSVLSIGLLIVTFFIFHAPRQTQDPSTAISSLHLPVTSNNVFLYFLKIGSTLYGGGYVLIAYLKTIFVDRLHWINQSQLLSAISVGQITPGPLFTTATFIGFQLLGSWGALLATIGIFLPAFVLVAIMSPILQIVNTLVRPRLFLDGINIGSMVLLAAALLHLAPSILGLDYTLPLFLGSYLSLLMGFATTTQLILGALALGFIFP